MLYKTRNFLLTGFACGKIGTKSETLLMRQMELTISPKKCIAIHGFQTSVPRLQYPYNYEAAIIAISHS